MKRYVIGLDYGTDSARGLLVDAVDGCELASAVVPYRRWGRGEYCDASKSQFRAASLGLCRGSRRAVALVARAVPRSIRRRGGHCRRHDIEHTVSCRREDASAGTSGEEFADDPDAMFVLWKDHTAECEAARIDAACRESETCYSMFSGGHYSSEGYWSKVIHILNGNPRLAREACIAIEQCDYIPALLTGADSISSMRLSHCAAGSKSMWSERWGGYPPAEFFRTAIARRGAHVRASAARQLHLGQYLRNRIERYGQPLRPAGGCQVAVGIIDAHAGAIGAGIRERRMALNLRNIGLPHGRGRSAEAR